MRAAFGAALVLICSTVALAKPQDVVRCTAGSPRWEGKAGKFRVVLDNSDSSGDCRLSISRGDQEAFSTHAKVIDLLARGVDLNMDTRPDLAFQTGPSEDCCWTLHILSLDGSPRAVGEIQNRLPFAYRGETDYGAQEFVTQDGAIAAGFDGLAAGELTDLPTVALLWRGGNALDAGWLHAREYGQTAAKLEKELSPERGAAFRASDGRLDASTPETQPLRKTKAQILALVMAYLYAGVDGSAEEELKELWPEQDLPRIRNALADALQRSVRRQLVQPAAIVNRNCQGQPAEPLFKVGGKVAPPRGTYVPDPGYSDQARAQHIEGTIWLAAVITSAGCVREVSLIRGLGLGLDENAIDAVLSWKFQPARRDGVPVAVRVNVEVNFRLR